MMDQLIKTFEWLARAYLFRGTDSNVSVDPLAQDASQRTRDPNRGYAEKCFPARVSLNSFATGDHNPVRLADFATIISIAALGYANGILALTLVGNGKADDPVKAITRLGSVDPEPVGVRRLEAWPPIFGVPAATQAFIEEAPAEIEPSIETAPVVWQEYSLRGLVTVGPQKWAFIVSDHEEALVSIGDTLGDGEVVVRIDAAGVWLEKQGERNLVRFNRNESVSIVELPPLNPEKDDGGVQAPVERIRIQDLDEEGLRNLLEKVRGRPGLRRPATQ